MPFLEPADRVLICGRTRLGKTEFVKEKVLVKAMAAGIPVIAIDPKDELSIKGRPRSWTTVGPLFYRWTAKQVARQPEILTLPNLYLSVVPDSCTPHRTARAFELVAGALKELAEEGRARHVILLAEEVQWWAAYGPTERDAATVDDVATIWADYLVTLVLVSQRAVGVPITARSQLSEIVSFAQTEPADIEALRIRTQLNDPTFHERIQRLQPREWQLWRAGAIANGEAQEQREERRPGGSGDESGQREQSSDHGGRDGALPLVAGENHDGAERGLGEGRNHLVQSGSLLQPPPEGDVTAAAAAGRTTQELGDRAPRRTRKKKAPAPPPPVLTTPRKKPRRRRPRAA